MMRIESPRLRVRWAAAWIGGAALIAALGPAMAQTYSRESDVGELRLGQRVLVDDGSCPAGQITEVSGTTLTAAGVTRVRKCIPRSGTKKK